MNHSVSEDGLSRLAEMTGQRLGVSPWHAVTQEQVNLFADATHDHQWIHVDPERAARGPFGGPIAHGYLTLAMLPALLSPMLRVSGVALSVNYGLNRVRFTSPVRIGARVRAVADVLRVDAVEGGVQVHLSVTVEIEGCDKPACVAETITRLYREQVRKVEEAKE